MKVGPTSQVPHSGILHEKQTHPNHTDHRADDFADRHFLVEEDGGGGDNEDGGEGEEGLGDARGGVLGGQQRCAHPDERSKDGGGKNAPHRLAVADRAS